MSSREKMPPSEDEGRTHATHKETNTQVCERSVAFLEPDLYVLNSIHPSRFTNPVTRCGTRRPMKGPWLALCESWLIRATRRTRLLMQTPDNRTMEEFLCHIGNCNESERR